MDQMRELLQTCDRALTDCDKLIATKDQKIQKQEELIILQNTQISDLKNDQNSILKNPVVWFVAGVLVGGITISLLAL
jgi:hypothetical protein